MLLSISPGKWRFSWRNVGGEKKHIRWVLMLLLVGQGKGGWVMMYLFMPMGWEFVLSRIGFFVDMSRHGQY